MGMKHRLRRGQGVLLKHDACSSVAKVEVLYPETLAVISYAILQNPHIVDQNMCLVGVAFVLGGEIPAQFLGGFK